MMYTKITLLIFTALLLFSCRDSIIDFEEDQPLVGYWINRTSSDSIVSFERSVDLAEGQYCFAFKEDGTFIERKNSGSCGTPPISFADFEGIWDAQDSVISITAPWWAGTVHYTWKIVSVNEQQFSYIVLTQDYEHD